MFCLSMIFKDEEPRLARAIASVRHLLSAYELSDTGSLDDSFSQAEIAVAGLPGDIHHDDWRNFAHNRNLSLERARRHNLPILFLDCDDEIFFGDPEQLGNWDVLTAWAYDGPLRHRRVLAVTSELPAFWEGVLHEHLTWDSSWAPKCVHSTHLKVRYRHDGVRHQNRNDTTASDVEQLQRVPIHSPSYDRAKYYLARTLHHAGKVQQAIAAYTQYLSTRQICDETTFHSFLSLAALAEAAGSEPAGVLRYLDLAKSSRPNRVEPVVMAARILREAGNAEQALSVCIDALSDANVPDDDFVDVSYYGWRLYDELATSAILADSYALGRTATEKALAAPFLPKHDRARLLANLSLIE